MTLQARIRRFPAILAATAIVALSVPAFAQDVPEAQLKAARAAVAAIHATDSFDGILPQAASALQAQLIQKNPDLQELIGKIVDEKALALASRRADLENEAALAYAKAFSEKELNDIAAFYNSDAGKKLLDNGPTVTRQLVNAAQIWQNGIARDLAQQVGEALAAAVKAKQPQAAPAASGDTGNGAAAPASAN